MVHVTSLTTHHMRQALSAGLTVAVASLVSIYFVYSYDYWIILSCFFVIQTTRGTPLKQSFNTLLVIIMALLFSSLLIYIHEFALVAGILTVIFVFVSYLLYSSRPVSFTVFYSGIVFLFVTLLGTLEPIQPPYFVHTRIADAVIGGVIGILCMALTYVQPAKAFKQDLIPLLKLLSAYPQALTNNFLEHKNEKECIETKLAIERVLQCDNSTYPEWAYEVGFNPSLRSGFRFFLITIERIIELCFSMNYLASLKINLFTHPNQHTKILAEGIFHAMHKNQELIAILLHYFVHNKLRQFASDFTSDISTLENALRQVVPHRIELLDIESDYMTVTAFVRDIKDMRRLLLELIMALP